MTALVERRLRWRSRALAGIVAALGLVVFFLAAPGIADAPDPAGPPSGTLTTNTDGTVTLTLSGTWQWPTHTKDCNKDRAGVGFAVDWNDESEPGFLVANDPSTGQPVDVGVRSLRTGDNVNQIDNVVHPTPRFDGDTTGAVDVASPSQFAGYRSYCGKFDPAAKFNKGVWGQLPDTGGNNRDPSTGLIQHTYPAGTSQVQICVLLYDVHGTGGGSELTPGKAKDAGEITAGGAGHNGDNTIQKNASTPFGARCISKTFSTSFPSGTTAQSFVPNDTVTISNGVNPTGTLTFSLFPPGDPTCAGQPVYTQQVAVTGNGTYATTNTEYVIDTSQNATPPGTYRWKIVYSGDSGNNGFTVACGAERLVITQ